MTIFSMKAAAILAATSGLAFAAPPTVDGTVDGAEASQYTIHYIQDTPTGFGDAVAGQFLQGQPGGNVVLGNPELVTTGIELAIPKSALGNETSFDFWAVIMNGDRKYPSNQMVHAGDFPQNTGNIGGVLGYDVIIDWGAAVAGTQSVNVSGIPTVADNSIVMDGTQDAGYAQYFVQNNYTQFGNATCGDADNGCGGSEIDNVAFAQDSNYIYVHVAGNLEHNGNALDMWFDTGAVGGQNTLAGGATDSGNGVSFFVNNQTGDSFETGFNANYGISVDWSFGTLRALYADLAAGTVQLAGQGQSVSNTSGGAVVNAEIPGFLLTSDDSNTAGVPGAEIGSVLPDEPDSPTSPDVSWAYGSEIDNVRSYIEGNKLYLFVGGNFEGAAANKMVLFWDTQAGGQNTLGISPTTSLPVDNPTISFEALLPGKLGGTTWDAGFGADWYNNFSFSRSGGNADPMNAYVDAATVRSEGFLIDEFFEVPADWAAYSGGQHNVALMNFPGTFADPADGRTFLGTDGGPRLTTASFGTPVGGVISAAANNSNVGGVTGVDADCELAAAVNTGFEACFDLDELGWDGLQDIKLFVAIVNGDSNYMSNQLAGDTAAISGNLGPTPIDFTTIAGDQYVNLMTDTATCSVDPCSTIDFLADGFLDNGDIGAFLAAFLGGNLAADINGDGFLDNGDIGEFVALFLSCI